MKTKRKSFVFLTLLIVFFFLGSLTTFTLVKFTKVLDNFLLNKNSVYEKNSLKNSVEKIYNAVVVVQSYNSSSKESSGTGFVYKKDSKYAYILTNEHILSESNETKVITASDELVEAAVLGKDKYLDLAVLRIDKKYINLTATIGSSETSNLGDTVFTVGSPLGYNYRGSVTSGILSGKERTVSLALTDSDEDDWVMQVLQVDASINPGNSGGPLLNVNGEVIGICSMKLVDDDIEGMGFAIPIEYAMAHISTLEKGEKIKWPVLGVGLINVVDTAKLVRNNLKVPSEIKNGVVIQSIEKNSAIADTPLKVGDIILKINDKEINNIAYLKFELYKHKPGDYITITYLRNNKQKSSKVLLKSE